MLERGMAPDFSTGALEELARITDPPGGGNGPGPDLRSLLWASIDNDDSRDLDQLSVAETLPGGATKVLVAIADVDGLVKKGSAIDEHARQNTTSVYTAGEIFPMLPERLSTDLTSLGFQEDRPAIVIEMLIGEEGLLRGSKIYGATVCNRAKLAYNSVAAWLEGMGPMPGPVAAVEGLGANLKAQDLVAQKLKSFRHEHGALDLETIEARPVFDGEDIRDLEVERKNRAKEIIEDFMIAANGVTARFLMARKYPSLRRVVRSPERWERIIEVASQYDVPLPSEPDSAALANFLALRKAADPLRFPDLSLTIVKLMGRGIRRRISGRGGPRALRARGPGLHALHRPESPLPRPRHATVAEGCVVGIPPALWKRGTGGTGPPLHREGRRREQGGTESREVGCGHAAGIEDWGPVRCDRHRCLGEGDVGPSLTPPRGREVDPRVRRCRCGPQGPRATGSHGRGSGLHRLQEGRLK